MHKVHTYTHRDRQTLQKLTFLLDFRGDKKVCNKLTGLGDGCSYCLTNPRTWKDIKEIEKNFPPPLARTFEFIQVRNKQNQLG